jgi:hypothetical protein
MPLFVLAGAADAPDTLPVFLGRVVLHLAAAWVLVTAVLGAISGHVRVLKAYPPVDEPLRQSFSLAAGILGRMPVRGPLHVGIGPRGLHIAPSWLFRPPTHWGIPCVPWWDLRCTASQTEAGERGSRWSRFEAPRIGIRFEVAGEAGRAIEAALEAAGG